MYVGFILYRRPKSLSIKQKALRKYKKSPIITHISYLMGIVLKSKVVVIGDTRLKKFSWEELPFSCEAHHAASIKDMVNLNVSFNEKITIVLSFGTEDAKQLTDFEAYQLMIDTFAEQLIKSNVNFYLAYIKPRFNKKSSVESQRNVAKYLGAAYNQLINHFPNMVMYSRTR